MTQMVRITSKRQITIPSKIFNQLNLNQGDRLTVAVHGNKIVMQNALTLVQELAGSLKVPKKYKNKSLDFIIEEAKRDYFSKKR